MENFTYQQYAVETFTRLLYQPKPEMYLRDDVKRIQTGYYTLVNAVVILCTPPIQMDGVTIKVNPKKLSAKEFALMFPKVTDSLLEAVTFLVDSSKYAVSSLDPEAPFFALDEDKKEMLLNVWSYEFVTSSKTLKRIFERQHTLIVQSCPMNHRTINALQRIQYSFSIADNLIRQFKGDDPQPYIKSVTSK